jgi:hypothetical protein
VATKVYETVGTPRQHRAARLFAENILKENPESTQKILIKAGYSAEVARGAAHTVTKTAKFQELLKEYLPLKNVVRKHQELLEHEDGAIQYKATELGYKVHGVIASSPQIQNQAVMAVTWQPKSLSEPDAIDVSAEPESKNPETTTPEVG